MIRGIRRHHNNKGLFQIKKGFTQKQIESIKVKLIKEGVIKKELKDEYSKGQDS